MFRLLKCEFKKFKSTYINALSFLGMMSPVALVTLMFLIKKSDFVKWGNYNWDYFNQQLSMFFIFLVGPIITSFIAVFAIYYEYQEKTIKNILTSPHKRTGIIVTKMIYISVYVVFQYAVIALINLLCALVLGFDISSSQIRDYSLRLILAGLTTINLVPLMMFVTLLFKSFIPAMILTVSGTISNVLVLNWDKSYISPWAIPPDIALLATSKMEGMDITYPITSFCIYSILFTVLSIVYFKFSDQNV
jgi:bacitracin transport system permease protein